MDKYVSRETSILILICVIDTFATAVLWMTGIIREANPIMAWALNYGIELFYAIRFGMIFSLAALAEWYKRFDPIFVERAMQVGIVVYISVYIISFIHVNT
ncbi:MAG: DUF5658 family protein [Armatimonadota bacterium]